MKDRRKDEIIKLLAQNRVMKVGELAKYFQVSMETMGYNEYESQIRAITRFQERGDISFREV